MQSENVLYVVGTDLQKVYKHLEVRNVQFKRNFQRNTCTNLAGSPNAILSSCKTTNDKNKLNTQTNQAHLTQRLAYIQLN